MPRPPTNPSWLRQQLYETWVEGNQERQGERIGYRANTRITLSLHDIERAGRAIQAILRAGATYIDGIAFRLNDDHQAVARAEARAAAIPTLCRQPLELGAGCGNAARPDPCGRGRSVTAVPCTLQLAGRVTISRRAARKAASLIRSLGPRTCAVDRAPLLQAPLFMPDGIWGRGLPLIPCTRWSDAEPCGVCPLKW